MIEWGFERETGRLRGKERFWGNIGLGNFQNMQATLRYLSVDTGRELSISASKPGRTARA